MKTTARTMSIFVFMAIVTTATLALGTSTAMAASNTHRHVIQLKSSGDDWFPTSTAMTVSNTHTHHHNMHLMSSNGNHLTGTNGINSIGSRNNDFPTGWVGGFGPTQYGSTVSHLYHHHIPTGTIAGIDGANRGNDINADFRLAGHSATEIGQYNTQIAITPSYFLCVKMHLYVISL